MRCIFISYAEFIITTGEHEESVDFALPAKSINSKLTQQTEADKKTRKSEFIKTERIRNKIPATKNNTLKQKAWFTLQLRYLNILC